MILNFLQILKSLYENDVPTYKLFWFEVQKARTFFVKSTSCSIFKHRLKISLDIFQLAYSKPIMYKERFYLNLILQNPKIR